MSTSTVRVRAPKAAPKGKAKAGLWADAGHAKRAGPRAIGIDVAPAQQGAKPAKGVYRALTAADTAFELTDVLEVRDAMHAVRLIQRGLPARLVSDAVKRFGVSKERLVSALGVSKPTLNRLARQKKSLDIVTSDVFKDAAQVLEKALTAFSDRDAMNRWMEEFNPALGCTPMELLGTKDGRELISTLIDRARYGVFS